MIDQGLDQDSLDLPQYMVDRHDRSEHKFFDNRSDGSNDFSFDQMCKNPTILIIGKSDSGGRELVVDLLNNYSHIPATLIDPYNYFSQIENLNIEKSYDVFDPEIIKELMKKQKEKRKRREGKQLTEIVRSDTLTHGFIDLLNGIKTFIEFSLARNELKCSDILDIQESVRQLAESKRDHMINEQLTEFSKNIQSVIRGSEPSDSLFKLQKNYDHIIDQKKMDINDFLSKENEEILEHVLVINNLASEFFQNDSYKNVIFNGMHYHLTNIVTTQLALNIPPDARSNFDYIFLFRDDVISNQKRLYEHYGGIFPDFNSFKQVYEQFTADGGCMVIKNRNRGVTDVLDKIAHYKSTQVP
jgi:hypothetical protein